MNLHALHIVNDRLQNAIHNEDLDRIRIALVDMSAEVDCIERIEKEKIFREQARRPRGLGQSAS